MSGRGDLRSDEEIAGIQVQHGLKRAHQAARRQIGLGQRESGAALGGYVLAASERQPSLPGALLIAGE